MGGGSTLCGGEREASTIKDCWTFATDANQRILAAVGHEDRFHACKGLVGQEEDVGARIQYRGGVRTLHHTATDLDVDHRHLIVVLTRVLHSLEFSGVQTRIHTAEGQSAVRFTALVETHGKFVGRDFASCKQCVEHVGFSSGTRDSHHTIDVLELVEVARLVLNSAEVDGNRTQWAN